MKDIVIDDKTYTFVSKYSCDDIDYIIFCDDDEIFVSEYRIVDNELELLRIDIKKQKEILESIGIDYGV